MTFHTFGVDMTGTERASGVQAGAAREFVSGHRGQIVAAAKEYGVDALVLANVLYQERRHAGIDDFLQDRYPEKNPNATLGPGQINVEQFKTLVKNGGINLSDDERRQYSANPEEFSRKFLIDPNSGIEATAAQIASNLKILQDNQLIPRIPNDGNPNTLSLGQFVYGAALYSAGGRTDGNGGEAFDRQGPTTSQIDLKNNNLFGLVSVVKQDEKIVTAFHYLPDTYEALYGKKAPERLDGYFNDTSILRDNRRSAIDAPQGTVANVDAAGQPTVAATAALFGNDGQLGNTMFKNLTTAIDPLTPDLNLTQKFNISGMLTQDSILKGVSATPTVGANEAGRIFAYDGGDTGRIAYVDPATAMTRSVEESAGKVREQLAAQPQSNQARDQTNPQETMEPRSRGPSV